MDNYDETVRRHRYTWDRFVKFSFWFTLHVIVLLVLMAIFLL